MTLRRNGASFSSPRSWRSLRGLPGALFFHETLRTLGTVPSKRLKFLAAHLVIRNEKVLNFVEQVRIEILMDLIAE
jgi:hypothetical protein